MRKRRKVNWFPVLGTNVGPDDPEFAGFDFNVGIPADGTAAIGIFPITYDSPQAEAAGSADTPLVDIVGSEYILKRIVGKLHLNLQQENPLSGASLPHAAIIGAGFFVARAEDTPNQNAPIGSAGGGPTVQPDYSPLAKRTIREPWVWRRTTILGVGLPPNNLGAGRYRQDAATAFPPTNASLSGVLDGPHFDSKSARRIGNDDRLWFAIAVSTYPLGTVPAEVGNLQGYLDVRLLGSLVKAHNRSTF